MRDFWFRALCLTAAFGGLFTSCDKEDNNQPLEDQGFVTFAGVGMRFVDGNGNDLINIDDMTTYPIIRPSIINSDSIKTILANMDSLYYGYNEYYRTNVFLYDGNRMEISKRDTGIFISPDIYGNHEGFTNNYLYVNGDIDTLRASWAYSYSPDCVGGSYCAKLTKLTYNGVIIKTEETFDVTTITVTKNNGKTSIKISH